ncbi:MAG: type II toxin-antitoxin system YoeB family toxin [Humibacillus sp.]|nr:type II toxin-antitoxin system YoeB family toxin [Humibacillus sp.]MDN5779977.1 type II toxin-antitoxin system YoeB family toxin [Humibacillus sp.]
MTDGSRTRSATARPLPRRYGALKHDLAGYWFRRITDELRLVYKSAGDRFRIAACRED